MRSMDLPRRSLSQLSDQPFQGPASDRFDVPVPRPPENGRAWPAVERDARARSPEELLDNLRLCLSDLAARHACPQRHRDSRGDRDGPPDYDAYLDPNIHHGAETQRDRDVPNDTDMPYDRDVPNDTDMPYDRDVPNDSDVPNDEGVGYGDAPDFDGSDHDGADDSGGLRDAIRAARELDDAFPGLAAGHPHELGLFADHGYEEPYRPWFMSDDPSTPWWASDGVF